MSVRERLTQFEATKGQAAVIVVGAGYVGTGVVHILQQTPGVRPALIANRNTSRAIDALTSAGIAANEIVVSDDPGVLGAAMSEGRPAVTSIAALVPELPGDVVVEATGAINFGTEVVLASLASKKHVISFNAECDELLASVFHERAAENGVVYTIADGDQPGVQLRLRDEVASMGFDVTALINCKRHLNVHQTPSSGADYAQRDTTSAKMTTSFGDGTKMQIEQAVVANAVGFEPALLGMHGIDSSVEHAAVDLGRILGSDKRVDYTLGGDFGAGVGVLASHPHHDLHEKAMRLYKMGDGPNYFFFRPYHLVHLELPMTLADVLIDHRPLAAVSGPHVAGVISLAKSALDAGTELDGIGGFAAYGQIDSASRAQGFLPIALSEFATASRSLASDEPIPLDAVFLDESRTVVREWLAFSSRRSSEQ